MLIQYSQDTLDEAQVKVWTWRDRKDLRLQGHFRQDPCGDGSWAVELQLFNYPHDTVTFHAPSLHDAIVRGHQKILELIQPVEPYRVIGGPCAMT